MTYTTSEILDLAADDLQRNGWTQGSSGMNVEGPHCAMGAIGTVIDAHILDAKWHTGYEARQAPFRSYGEVESHPAGVALREYLPSVWAHIYLWNDALVREGWEVIATLRAAAAVERVKETSDDKVSA